MLPLGPKARTQTHTLSWHCHQSLVLVDAVQRPGATAVVDLFLSKQAVGCFIMSSLLLDPAWQGADIILLYNCAAAHNSY